MSNSEDIKRVYDEDGTLVAESPRKKIATITTRLAVSTDVVGDDMLLFKPLYLTEKMAPPKHPEFLDIPDIGGYVAGVIIFPLRYNIVYNDDFSDSTLNTYEWDEEGSGLETEMVEAVKAHADEYWTDEIYTSYREHLSALMQSRLAHIQQSLQQEADEADPE